MPRGQGGEGLRQNPPPPSYMFRHPEGGTSSTRPRAATLCVHAGRPRRHGMPTTPPSSSRLDAVEDLRRALNALGEVDVALTLRAGQLPDEQSRGILECILRDHLGKAIAELKDQIGRAHV